jgi:hypothetical protein
MEGMKTPKRKCLENSYFPYSTQKGEVPVHEPEDMEVDV